MAMKPVILGVLVATLGLGTAVVVDTGSPQPARHGSPLNTLVDGVDPDTPHGTLPDSDHD
jgi:hypothetical protein